MQVKVKSVAIVLLSFPLLDKNKCSPRVDRRAVEGRMNILPTRHYSQNSDLGLKVRA